MKLFRVFATILSLLAVYVLSVPQAAAGDWDRKTVITFSGPVEVPGVGAQTLPAGTYVFKILDSQSDRHIVQIFNKEENHLFTTILAIPNYRLKTTDKTVITFSERPAGQPEALRAWFYPGREWGEEFVYAKSRAIELAKETNEPVLETPMELASAPIEALKTAPIEAVDPKGEPVELAKVVEAPPVAAAEPVAAPAAAEPVAAVEPAALPAAEPVAAAKPVAAPAAAEPVTAPAAAEPVTVAAADLPKTASPLPLIGLIGLLALGAGFALSAFSKRVV